MLIAKLMLINAVHHNDIVGRIAMVMLHTHTIELSERSIVVMLVIASSAYWHEIREQTAI